jgi:hypothetical protein
MARTKTQGMRYYEAGALSTIISLSSERLLRMMAALGWSGPKDFPCIAKARI